MTTQSSAPGLETPVLFMVFNRPQTTKRVFEAIRAARPTQLYVAADGPRSDRPDDEKLCKEVRDIVTNVDWPCTLKTLFREQNVGIMTAGSSNVSWFFDNVEEGIILEDDDVPEPTFFTFCTELLEKYRDNPRVMSICGTNVQQHNKKFKCDESYYFLSLPNFWGMATWRRAWKHYDINFTRWPEIRDKKFLYEILPSAFAFHYMRKFQWYYDKKANAYDGPWVFASFINRGLAIYPSRNLISNIGFGMDAHGCKISDPLWDSQPTEPMPFPLIHPKEIKVNRDWEEYGANACYQVNRYWSDKAKWWLKLHFTEPYLFVKKWYYKILLPERYERDAKDDERVYMPFAR